MSAALRDALRDLTDDVPPVRPTPPASHELWEAGVRRRRGTALTRLLVGLAVIPLVAFTLPWLPASVSQPEPTADGTAGAVPDHFWSPGVWADGTEGSPPGRLALVAPAERGTWWLGRQEAWYGVTAVGQGYVWLDLPGQPAEEGRDVALSPDGRFVAYWLAGTPRLEDAQSDVVGFAVYDTVTGEVRVRQVRTDRGLAPRALAWSPDSRRLVAHYGQYRKMRGLASFGQVVSWDPERGTLIAIRGLQRGFGLAPGLGGVVTSDGDGGLLVGDPASGTTRRLRLVGADDLRSGGVPDSILSSPSGSRVAMRGELRIREGITTTGMWVAERDGERLVDARLLDRRWQLNRVLGWLDEDRVLAEAHRRGGYGLRYVAYDVRTGRADPVIGHSDPEGRWLQAHFATDLLQRPFVAGQAPETPAAPHWWLVGVLGLGGAAVAVRRWSHRRPTGVS